MNGKAEGEASGQYVFGDERTADPSTSLRFGRDDKEESSAFKRQVQWRGEKAGPRSTTLRASSPLCCSSVGDKGSGDAFPRMLWPGRGAQRVPPLRFAPVGACDFFDLLHTKVGTQDCILGDFQPSLRSLSNRIKTTQSARQLIWTALTFRSPLPGLVCGGGSASWLFRPLKGTWFPLVSFPGTSVPGSGFFRTFRDWFAEKICGNRATDEKYPDELTSRSSSRGSGIFCKIR